MANKLCIASFALPSFMSWHRKDPAQQKVPQKQRYRTQQQHLFDCDVLFFIFFEFVSDYVQVNPDKNLLVG